MDNILRIVIGLAGLVGAAWSASRTLRLRRDGRHAEAVVVESHKVASGGAQGSTRTLSTVRYVDESGREQTAFLPGEYPAGANVEITYLPGRKDQVSRRGPASFVEAYAILAATAGAVALTLLMG